MIESSSTDTKNEIKKRLGETLDLKSKIKKIETKNKDLVNENIDLK